MVQIILLHQQIDIIATLISPFDYLIRKGGRRINRLTTKWYKHLLSIFLRRRDYYEQFYFY